MTLFNVHSQTIKDSIFNEVYIIKSENIIKNDNVLFINIAIQTQKTPVVFISSDRNVTAKLFCDRRLFLPEQNEFILITPDWEFIKEIREIEKREGIHIKAEKHKFYYIERNITDCKIDSLSRSIHDVRNPIVLNYKDISSKKDTRKLLINSDNIIGRSKLTYSQNKSVSGIIKDETGQSLPGAIVISQKSNEKTASDIDGKYSLKVSINDTLTFSYVGLKTQKIIADKDTINVEMQIDERNFGREVVHITYKPKKLTAKNIKNVFEEEAKKNHFIVFVSNLSIYSNFSEEELKFQEKYNIIYSSTENYDVKPKYLEKYNKLTFKHLNKKYTKSWQNKIRKDAIGLVELLR